MQEYETINSKVLENYSKHNTLALRQAQRGREKLKKIYAELMAERSELEVP